MQYVSKIRSINTFFTVMIIIEIISFAILLFAGSINLTLGIFYAFSFVLMVLFVSLLNAIADGIESAIFAATSKKAAPSEDRIITVGQASMKKSSSAWRDFNGDNK